MIVNKGALARVIAALLATVLIIFSLSVIDRGPKAPPDYACDVIDGAARVSIDIAAGESGSQIARELFEKGVTKSIDSFFRVAVSDPSSEGIAPGLHSIDKKICAELALTQLLDSERIGGLIPIIEGAWEVEIEKLFVEAGYPIAEVKQAFAKVEIPAPFLTLEGLLFPSQYSFANGTPALIALEQILARAITELSSLGYFTPVRNYSAPELLTIASIIQAEGDVKDFDKVSQVIYNRLRIGMPLQMDSTVNYIEKRRGQIFLSTKSTLINSPYNTYRSRGLPPSPIGNPGKLALSAALNPAAGKWLYFITVAPGDTRFTDSFDEFNGWKLIYKANLRSGKFGDN